MARYFTRPCGWYFDEEGRSAPLPLPTVYPSEPRPTGLLTADGQDIYKGPDAMGFIKPPDTSGGS